jgi:DNA-binding transcriptional MerR regulator
MDTKQPKLLRVGELARAVGKSVRAIHLYEELGLLAPVSRSQGGFRLFAEDAVERIAWINKLQVIGFSLPEIQAFIAEFGKAGSGRLATGRVRSMFEEKLARTRETMAQLEIVESDLLDALAYLDSCSSCATIFPPSECGVCTHQGHAPGSTPELFAGLAHAARGEALGAPAAGPTYDVDIANLMKDPDGNN